MQNTYCYLLFYLALTSVAKANEQQATTGPTLNGYGPTFAVHNKDVELPEGFIYKAVFDISKTPDDKSQYNYSIESLARFINMHTRNGVKIGHIKLAAVFHGSASKNALNHAAYKKRYGTSNPNLELIKQLSDLGVDFYICGQSAGFNGIDKNELDSHIKLGLSAMTMFVLLQEEGYKLIP